jgi:hypothetical protein
MGPLTPQVAVLRDLWVAPKRPSCIPATAYQRFSGATDARYWQCDVPGWDSVMLITALDGTIQGLTAETGDTMLCNRNLFAPDAVRAGEGMEAAIVSVVTVKLVGGPFSGKCMGLEYWYDRPRCDVSIFSPDPRRSRSNPGSERSGCSGD